MNPKILFEISVLGYAAHGAAYRTGVFRMVDQWARGLAARQDLDLLFSSLLDARTSLRSQYYWSHSPGLSQRPFAPRTAARSILQQIDHTFLDLARTPGGSVPKKIVRRGLSEVLRFWEKRGGPDIAAVSSQAQIFHANFWPFPKAARKATDTRFLMTFVDLINLVNPELSTDGGAFYRGVLDSLQSDDFTVSISEATRQDVLRACPDLDPKKSFVAHLAASPDFRPVDSKHELSKRLSKWSLAPDSYILSVCTLEKRKNLDLLIDAFEAWASRANSKTRLVLTGASGNAMDSVRNRLAHSKVKDHVLLTGFVDDADLAPLYQGAAAFAYPSLQEGFGLPVLEALQCGAVVVTADNSSLPEVGGDAVIYCDAKKKDSIVEALQTAMDGTGRAELQRKALVQAGKFSWEKSVQKLAEIYQQMRR
jgi:glycosyltransferase involved in cell wall biosynthesis